MKIVLTLLLFLPSIASAWGSVGHEIVCEIAFQELSTAARSEVKRLIELDTEINTFPESCGLADLDKERAADHYLNVPRNLKVITTDECPLAESCLFPAIGKDLKILSDKSQPDNARLEALTFLGHWVGDMHQPLHVSFQDDRGGNNIDTAGMCWGTLHGVWDGCLIELQLGKDANAIANDFIANIADDERRSWRSESPIEWANESFQVTISPQTGYCTQMRDGCWYWPYTKTLKEGNLQREMIISQSYLSANQEIVELRLKQAGIRLAAVLNQALKDR